MPKTVKIKVKKITKKPAVKKPKKAAVKRRAVKASVKPRKAKPAITAKEPVMDAEKKKITHEDIERKIDEIDIEGIIKKERDKRMILWAGVSFFMILIFAFWIFNLKQTFKQIESKNTGGEDLKLDKITGNFSKTMGEMKKNLAEIKKFTDKAKNYEVGTSTASTINASTTPAISTSTEEKIISTGTPVQQGNLDEIEVLKARLEKLENKLNANTE